VKWNFQKYLIGRNGNIIARFLSAVEPLSDDVTSAVEKALGEKCEIIETKRHCQGYGGLIAMLRPVHK
jgi:hypothetical protein